MKSVWILQTGEPVPGDLGNPRKLRAFSLAEKLSQEGITVTIWTSRFDHTKKLHRVAKSHYSYNELIKVKLIDSPGYKNNISFARLFDHFIIALNFKKELKKIDVFPDLVFVGFPPIELAYLAIRWAKRNSIRTILDYKDLWPEIFLNILKGRFKKILRLFFYPFFYMSQNSLKQANSLISISDPFLNKAISISGRKRTDKDKVIPLTTDNTTKKTQRGKEDFESIIKDISYKKEKDYLISFAGTFMVDVFDFSILKDILEELRRREISIKIILAGEGQEKKLWEDKFFEYKDIFFTGWVDKELLSRIQEESLAIFIPLKDREDFSLSIPNKAIDALSKGKIILTGTNSYLSELLESHEAGFRYKDHIDLSDIIESLINEKEKYSEYESNAMALYESKFEFHKVYSELLDLIYSLDKLNEKSN